MGRLAGRPALRPRAGLAGTDAIAAAFMADVIGLVRTATGRQVGVWQEAAECGALQPDDGYVVGWKSSADCRRLAAAGYQVVAAPAEVYYLDMAGDDEWRSPGASWAGSTSVADIEALRRHRRLDRRRAGQPPRHPGLPVDRARPRPRHPAHLLHPRLDAIAASAWTSEFRF